VRATCPYRFYILFSILSEIVCHSLFFSDCFVSNFQYSVFAPKS
jgi:hypothetical protein